MCLYNAVVLSAVGLTLTLLLGEQVVVLYGITSGCVIIGTTVTQAIVFVPKVPHFKSNLTQSTVKHYFVGSFYLTLLAI